MTTTVSFSAKNPSPSSLSRSIAERVPFHAPGTSCPPARCQQLPMTGPSFEEGTTTSPKEFQDPGPPIERHSLRQTKAESKIGIR
jgi:hypothetical protein